jgi:predicted XRE-type DNA-binding protein
MTFVQTKPLYEQFWERVERTEDCWKWTGTLWHGYGRIWARDRYLAVHRYSWMLHYGTIPEGLYVLHYCDNPACVRPDHLFLGTHQDNMDDCTQKDRQARGEENGKARLTIDGVLEIRRLWKTGRLSQTQIAEDFGVSRQQIQRIVTRQQWKHI